MKRYVFLMISVLIVILVNALAFAQKHVGQEPLFDVNQANIQYELIKKKLLGNNGISTLGVYVNQLEDLHDHSLRWTNYQTNSPSIQSSAPSPSRLLFQSARRGKTAAVTQGRSGPVARSRWTEQR